MKKIFTSFLFADSSFIAGMASSFNVPGNFYNFNSSDDPDALALSNDVSIIEQDIREVINGNQAK